jgi:hypothetical protein
MVKVYKYGFYVQLNLRTFYRIVTWIVCLYFGDEISSKILGKKIASKSVKPKLSF